MSAGERRLNHENWDEHDHYAGRLVAEERAELDAERGGEAR